MPHHHATATAQPVKVLPDTGVGDPPGQGPAGTVFALIASALVLFLIGGVTILKRRRS